MKICVKNIHQSSDSNNSIKVIVPTLSAILHHHHRHQYKGQLVSDLVFFCFHQYYIYKTKKIK